MTNRMQGRLCELEAVTRDYARYSRSAGGLASVLGGVFCLLSYLLAGLLPLTPALRAALVALPIAWLLVKWIAVRRYYQRYGRVEEQVDTAVRRTHRFCVGTALVVAVLVTASVLLHATQPSPGALGYLALVWLMVLATWRWLRSPLDFFVGVFLFCQAALLCVDRAYPVLGTAAARDALPVALLALLFPLAALGMIVRGVADHRRFRQLCERLQRLRGDTGGEA